MADIQEILGTDLVKDSRKVINENFNKVACDFAGTAFPTNPNIGMVCYRTDENKAYRYVDNDVWKVEGSVLTVNNNKPNDNGNVTVDIGVTSVNGAKGAVTVFDGNYNNLSNKPSLNFLPLSGGKMTGSILSSANTNATLQNLDASGVGGAEFYLFERDNATYKGGFLLRAMSAATPQGGTFIDLTGKSNGELSWGNEHIVRSINSTYADANGNVHLSCYDGTTNNRIHFKRDSWITETNNAGYFLEENTTNRWIDIMDYNNLKNKPNADSFGVTLKVW